MKNQRKFIRNKHKYSQTRINSQPIELMTANIQYEILASNISKSELEKHRNIFLKKYPNSINCKSWTP